MILSFSKTLDNEEIFANGSELASIMGYDRKNGKRILSYPENHLLKVHTFSKPVLVTDNHKISKLSPSLRDTLFSLFSAKPRTVEYNGVSVIDRGKYPSVWSPSIDTLVFAKYADKLFSSTKIKKAVEIGTGSGFLSKYLLYKNKFVESVLVNDINPDAIRFAMENINDKRALFYAGNGVEKIKDEKYDLIICNPPYIPRPKSIDDNPYEGIGLLYYLIHNGQNYLNNKGIFITNISSLCWKIVLKDKPAMKLKILGSLEVPLKVNNVMNNKEWLSYLLKNKLLMKKHKAGYDYWQKINIVAFENKF